MLEWKKDFYHRLVQHVRRVQDQAPILVAFMGKRQFSQLFDPPLKKVESYGIQTRLPTDWPVECRQSEVWVLPSSSGRAAMTVAERMQPYQSLAKRVQSIPWPLPKVAK